MASAALARSLELVILPVMTHTRPTNTEMLDPDVRFLLANERTLLAWVRTGLTIQAAGYAIIHFSDGALSGVLTGVSAMVVGGLLAMIGYRRFQAADKAIRNHQLPHVGTHQKIEILLVVSLGLGLAIVQIVALMAS